MTCSGPTSQVEMRRLGHAFGTWCAAWHAYAVGQPRHVTEGIGRVEARGGNIILVGAGDTIYTLPGEWHWHGATEDHFMAHPGLGTLRRRAEEGAGRAGDRRRVRATTEWLIAPA